MYSAHPIFIDPEGKNLKLWRFMDFTKFVSMLSKKALFFCKANCLGDNWEGTYPKKEKDNFYKMFEDSYPTKDESTHQKILEHIKEINHTIKDQKSLNFINCWHYNDTESAAMWKLYLKSNEGIVIKSDFNKFKNCFKDTTPNVYIGKVHYVDYEVETFYYPIGNKENFNFNLFRAFAHKRKSYFHENEYRAIIMSEDKLSLEQNSIGVYVPINLDILIQEIVVAPNSPGWFFELVNDMQKLFKLDKTVSKSLLDKNPFE